MLSGPSEHCGCSPVMTAVRVVCIVLVDDAGVFLDQYLAPVLPWSRGRSALTRVGAGSAVLRERHVPRDTLRSADQSLHSTLARVGIGTGTRRAVTKFSGH